MFNLVLLHFSDQEVSNVYRSRGNTTAACKHVTSFFLFFFLFSFFKRYGSFFIQVTLNPKEPPLVFRSRAWILMLVDEQT